jgi:hypothetical protein
MTAVQAEAAESRLDIGRLVASGVAAAELSTFQFPVRVAAPECG